MSDEVLVVTGGGSGTGVNTMVANDKSYAGSEAPSGIQAKATTSTAAP